MSPEFLSQLRARSESIQERWRTLLRIEPVSGPLANPETLQYLIPEIWKKVLTVVVKPPRRPITLQSARAQLPSCSCGHNPYRAFFTAAEQAVTEAAVLIQAEQTDTVRKQNDVAELIYAIRSLARNEIDTFCSACIHRGTDVNCRFAAAPTA